MQTIVNPREFHSLARSWRQAKKRAGFVPTMGALHEGHLDLVRACRKQNDITVVSIYVNPLQFGPKEDLHQYPRNLEKDLELLRKEKVHFVYTPTNREMYPKGFATEIHVKGPIVSGLCASYRPGHFDGVATVVVKLLSVVQPDQLYLGQKDAQQVAVLKKVVQDLDMDVEIVVCPIVREHDGLAMSSRNQKLSLKGRKIAPVLYRALKVGKSIVDLGENRAEKVLNEIKKVIADERKITLQYLDAVDAETLEPVWQIKPGTMIALAAYLDNVRLIDNIVL